MQQLVHAAQRRIRQAAEAQRAPRPAPLLAIAFDAEVAAGEPELGADPFRLGDDAVRRQRVADDRRLAAAKNPRLLAADRLAVGAEVLAVVDVDAGPDRAVAVERGDGVEPAAEPDLEDDEIERSRRKERDDREQRELEIRERDVAARSLHRLERRQQRRGADPRAADPAALLEMDQVRLRVQADAVAG